MYLPQVSRRVGFARLMVRFIKWGSRSRLPACL